MSASFYETNRAIAEYLLFHYGTPEQVLTCPDGPADALDFPARCVRQCLDPARLGPAARALDLGCAVGRAAFELARVCVEVVGIDYSHRFVAAARQLQEHGAMELARTEEGELVTPITVRVPPELDRSRVRFEQGDAHTLREDLGVFDVVLLANLIDRLHDPRRCLARLPGLVRPGRPAHYHLPLYVADRIHPERKLAGRVDPRRPTGAHAGGSGRDAVCGLPVGRSEGPPFSHPRTRAEVPSGAWRRRQCGVETGRAEFLVLM